MPKLPFYQSCFVCGDRNPAGLHVRFQTDGERVWTAFTPEAPQMGYRGITHGGILAALLDETMGWSPAVIHRRFCVSVELSVTFAQPLPLGVPVTVAGWTTRSRSRMAETAGEVADQSGAVYARATGRYVFLTTERTLEALEYLTFDEGCVPQASLRHPDAPDFRWD